jgi:hypothetical protein
VKTGLKCGCIGKTGLIIRVLHKVIHGDSSLSFNEEIVFNKTTRGYSATQMIVSGGLHPDPQPLVNHLGYDLECVNHFADESNVLNGVYCRSDERPVDDALIEIEASLEEDNNLFKVTRSVTRSIFDLEDEMPVVTEIGREMSLEIPSLLIPAAIHCVDTSSFADSPGEESLIQFNQVTKLATIASRSVRLRGQDEQPWINDENNYLVNTRDSLDENFFLSIRENVETDVDWSLTDSCYRFIAINSFRVHKNERGNWTGIRQTLPIIAKDPSVANCSHPFPALPPQVAITCSTAN